MTASTFTWSNASGGIWTDGTNWVGGTAPAISGTTANSDAILLSTATSGPITLFASSSTTGSIIAGSVSLTANTNLEIFTGQTLAAAFNAAAGANIAVNAGTVDLLGGTLKYVTTSVGGGEIFGYGLLTNPAAPGTLGTSAGGLIIADVNGGGGTGVLDILGNASNNLLTASGNYQIDAGATLKFDSNVVMSTSNIDFTTSADTLNIVNAATAFTTVGSVRTFVGNLNNLAVGSVNHSSTGASVITFNVGTGNTINSTAILNGSTLEAIVNTTTFLFDTNGAFTGDHLQNDGGTGTVSIWVDSVCYAAGTRVLTEDGEVPVEQLVEGSQVVTLVDGEHVLQPVKWLGHRHLDLTRHPQAHLAAPVRIRRGAFGENLPHRDLVVSPDHCVFVDGKLIPAKLLINDMTIVQERDARAVTYYHVELPRHSVMLAEGLPAESYLDTGNRAFFANTGLALVLHPEFTLNAGLKTWQNDACAPLALSEAEVAPTWNSLVERAESLGHRRPAPTLTADPDLQLVADGRVIRPLSQEDGRYVFALPAGVESVRLTSRATVPSHLLAYRDDWRQLGVAVRRITVRSSEGVVELPPDHPGLTRGWYAVERDDATMWRWMDGNAVLPIDGRDGPAMVEVTVGMSMTHVVDSDESRLAA